MEGWDQIDHHRGTRGNQLLVEKALRGVEEVLLCSLKVESCSRMER